MLSIIIPVFNEEKQIGILLRYLQEHTQGQQVEFLVVDGGSTDDTLKVIQGFGVEPLSSPNKGRSHQMNYGASRAKGDCLYFLHADTLPPTTFAADIQRALDEGAGAGCFRLRFDNNHPALKAYAWFTRWDIDLFRFGDQSLFVRRALFEKIRGYDTRLLVMEDQEIVKRLKNHAHFSILAKPVVTSARKYEQIGIFQLQFIFSIIVLLYYLRVDQRKIATFYRKAVLGIARLN